MASRLASLSTPSRRSRASPSPSPSPAPASPARSNETTHHRMLKLILSEVGTVLSTWDDILLVDGLKSGKGCIDEATEMDNILTMPDGPERPRVGPHLEALGESRASLLGVLAKLDKLLLKLSALIEQSEKLLFDACAKQPHDFVFYDPLWLSWTLENFVDSIPPLLSLHNAELAELTSLARILLSPSTKFEAARAALERWRDLAKSGERWCAAREWEEMTALEVAGGQPDLPEDEGKGRRKKR